jgi:tetratricopeptide (TPR) repeat protein
VGAGRRDPRVVEANRHPLGSLAPPLPLAVAPVADEWFRSPSWDEDARSAFEKRLRRAKPHNRPQYLRIKALALIEADLRGEAILLLRRIVDDYPESFEVRFAHELLGNAWRDAGRLGDAEREYRSVLAVAPDLNGTTGEVHLLLAEVLFERGANETTDEIQALLETAKPHVRLITTAFRRFVLVARVAERAGDLDVQRSAAVQALDLVGAPPQFARHPTVGIVDAKPETIADLRRLAGL